jgi:hypothetical protein
LFRKARRWAERQADEWYILSAKWGLVHPDRVIAPYNETLSGAPTASRRDWAARALPELLKLVEPGDRIVFLAGQAYRQNLVGALRERGCAVEAPMQGLGIGRQLQWLDLNA